MQTKAPQYEIKFGQITVRLIHNQNRAYLQIGSTQAYTVSFEKPEDAAAMSVWAIAAEGQLRREAEARRAAAMLEPGTIVMHSAVGEDAIRMYCILSGLDPDEMVVGINATGLPNSMKRSKAMQYDLARLSMAADPCRPR